jgi:hypothetical protein
LCDEGEISGLYEADPVCFQFLAHLPGDCHRWGFGV